MKFPFSKNNNFPEPETQDEEMQGFEYPSEHEEGITSEIGTVSARDVLSYFAQYPQKRVRDEFSELGKMVIDPAPLMGIGDGTDVAQIINLLSVQRLHYMTVPECLKGDTYMIFDLFVAVAKPMVNLAKDGRLLQSMTRFRIEKDIPDYFVAYMLRQQERELAEKHAKDKERGGLFG